MPRFTYNLLRQSSRKRGTNPQYHHQSKIKYKRIVYPGYKRSIRGVYRHVWNQRNVANCLHIAGAHMLTMLYRLKDKRYRNLVFSPQGITNYGCDSEHDLQLCLSRKRYGLQSIRRQPFLRMPISNLGYPHGGERFTLQNLVSHDTREAMIKVLIRNFGQGGPSHPLLGSTYALGGPGDDSMEFPRTTKTHPFRPPNFNGGGHTVVITGIYVLLVDSELVLSIEIKNSWGVHWGHNGYAWVTVDFFDVISEPIF